MEQRNGREPATRRRARRNADLWRMLVDPDQDLPARKRVLSDLLLAYPGRLTIIYFIALVVIATILLMLPVSSRSPNSTDPLTAFYTAVSALSTCGIPIVNSTEHWSQFGQSVILLSVQLGGLGVMTFASLVMLATARHLRASQRLRTANELGAATLGETKDVLAVVFATTFIIEGITFAALFPGLFAINKGDVGQTAWESLFYAVSAYNNNGSVVLGTAEGGTKITLYAVNRMDPTDVNLLNEWYFKTIHHEFAHILHQTKPYSTDFDQITGTSESSRYVGNDCWAVYATESAALKAGFISRYAATSADEDFVELISIYVTNTASTWSSMLSTAGSTGRSMIEEKFEIAYKYMQNEWNIDLDQLREVVLKRQAEVPSMDLDTL